MDRVILHVDANNFYASVECILHPELRQCPMVVGGSAEARHGVVLAKNELAKQYGIRTGEALWQARQKCAPVVVVPPHHKLYDQYSRRLQELYLCYTSQVEPFGLDECWLDVTRCSRSGPEIAQEIRERVKAELGLTVSIGVSFNKVFAKLGSDYKKPDAVTVISRENYRSLVWPLPVSDLLYVGPATTRKLKSYGITTIGGLAGTTPDFLQRQLGKMGEVIHRFAGGEDTAPVAEYDQLLSVKSIGNSTTTYRDMSTDEDIKMVLYALAESVAARVREQGLYADTVCIWVRDVELHSFTRQCKLPKPSSLASEYAEEGFRLFQHSYHWPKPVRSLGLSVTGFAHHPDVSIQLDFESNQRQRDREEKLEDTLDRLRGRFGSLSVQRAVVLQDRRLTGVEQEERLPPPN